MRLLLVAAVAVCWVPLHAELAAAEPSENADTREARAETDSAASIDPFDAKVQRHIDTVKTKWPFGDPKSRLFYIALAELKADFENNNAWIFENPQWPLMLQARAERKIRTAQMVAAAQRAKLGSSSSVGKGKSPFGNSPELGDPLDLDSTYVRKDGEAKLRRRVRDYKNPVSE